MNRLIPLATVAALILAFLAATSSPTATAQVPSTATPAATSTAVPATSTPAPTQTPFVVTNTVTVFCEGPIQLAPSLYVAGTSGLVLNPFVHYQSFGLGYPYNGVYGWAQPTLVTRINGVVDFSRTFPNHPACTPAATPVPPRAPDVATPIIVRVVERAPAAPVVAPAVVSQPARAPIISPPRTGDAGLE